MSLIFRDRSPSVEDDDPGERVVRRRGATKGQSTTRKTHRAPAKKTAAEPKVSKSNVRSLLSASQQASEPSVTHYICDEGHSHSIDVGAARREKKVKSRPSSDSAHDRRRVKLKLKLSRKGNEPKIIHASQEEESDSDDMRMYIDGGADVDTAPEFSAPPGWAKQPKKTASKRPPATTRLTKMASAPYCDPDEEPTEMGSDEDTPSSTSINQQLSLMTPALKRSERKLDMHDPEHRRLIARATKVGSEYYDSDEELAGNVKDTSKPHLFRNVKWGTYATDSSNDAEFTTEPEFTQFVPGRFEFLPDGSVSDQKAKLVIKLLDNSGRKRIFTNPPPRDWNNQEAISALNKRTVQQIRRNTCVRFRDVVHAYVQAERRWILANLVNGKPKVGWKDFVMQFNAQFEGKVIEGATGPRPFRSVSSLTKEVERFGPMWYAKGLVPLAMSTAS